MRKKLFFCIFFLFLCLNGYPSDKEKIVTNLREKLLQKSIKMFDPPEELAQGASPLTQELTINLRNPSYKNGILTTHDGGVIQNKDIRIQAQTIQYTKRMEEGKLVHIIEAEGDLMLQYKGRIYVGEELEYNFEENSGVIYEGKTFASPWYLGGDKIFLRPDGSYQIENVSLTTCENIDSSWDIYANNVSVSKPSLLKAKKVRFRLFKIPTLWLPSFNVNLKKFFSTPLIRYKVNWDKGSGPRVSFRYRLYSWKEFAFFTRLDYRLKRGLGGALETEYYPKHKRTTMETKNYVARDMLVNDPKEKLRYRFQGAYHTFSPTKKTTADIVWDKYSDIHMPADFKSDDFEINTAKRTELFIRHQENDLLTLLYARPRINPFDSIRQEIPSLFLTLRPLRMPKFGIVSHHNAKLSYLDYVYSDDLATTLPQINSMRISSINHFYRPFCIGPISFAPHLGLSGIFYNNSPEHNSAFLGSINYGCLVNTQFFRLFEKHKHIIEPYMTFDKVSRPTVGEDKHYIFGIQDGYHRINTFKLGVKNLLFSRQSGNAMPTFYADFFAHLFYDDTTIPLLVPKVYCNFGWNLPSVSISSENSWHVKKQKLNYANIKFGWTVNKDAALALEFRSRSRYDWRKADHENFILDVARTEKELLESPLSDKRMTVLTHMFVRLGPYWSFHVESHHGFNRKKEGPYNEFKIDLYTTLSTSWKAKITYWHSQVDDRVTAGIFLVKK